MTCLMMLKTKFIPGTFTEEIKKYNWKPLKTWGGGMGAAQPPENMARGSYSPRKNNSESRAIKNEMRMRLKFIGFEVPD